MTASYHVHFVVPAREEEILLDLLRQHIAALRIPFPLVVQGKEVLVRDHDQWGTLVALYCSADLTPMAIGSLEQLFWLLRQKGIVLRGAVMVKYRAGAFDDLEIRVTPLQRGEKSAGFELFPAALALPAPEGVSPGASFISRQGMSGSPDRQQIRDFVSGLVNRGKVVFALVDHYWGDDEGGESGEDAGERDWIPLFDASAVAGAAGGVTIEGDTLVEADGGILPGDGSGDGPAGGPGLDRPRRYTLRPLNNAARSALEVARTDQYHRRQLRARYEAVLAENPPAPQDRACDACGGKRPCRQRPTGLISMPLAWMCRRCEQRVGIV